jgi:prepilin-type N-terminal cleavage/methylation domain-containing protein
MINKKTTTAGFTLVETLVAIVILVTAIAGPLTIAARGLQVALIAKDQTTALYLAQDALEYIRYVRDSNRLSGQAWLSGLAQCLSTTSGNGCNIDSFSDHPPSPCAGASSQCVVDQYAVSSSGLGYTSASTIFTRKILITTPVNGQANEASVVVTVTWSDVGTVAHTVVARENILNWQ